MTVFESLLQEAADNGIPVFEMSLNGTNSIVADCGNEHAAICLNSSISSERNASEAAAHELGHCFTRTYYDSPYCHNNRRKMEHQADVWMVNRLLPPDKIREAWRSGCYETWEIAEHCDITEKLVKRAIDIYRCKGML